MGPRSRLISGPHVSGAITHTHTHTRISALDFISVCFPGLFNEQTYYLCYLCSFQEVPWPKRDVICCFFFHPHCVLSVVFPVQCCLYTFVLGDKMGHVEQQKLCVSLIETCWNICQFFLFLFFLFLFYSRNLQFPRLFSATVKLRFTRSRRAEFKFDLFCLCLLLSPLKKYTPVFWTFLQLCKTTVFVRKWAIVFLLFYNYFDFFFCHPVKRM